MILYNGQTGGLGRYFAATLAAHDKKGIALQSRLEDRDGLRAELQALPTPTETSVVLVQMAARVPVALCEEDPEGTFRTNVTDTVATVLDFVEWAKSIERVPRVIYVSTGHVYAASKELLDESALVAPRSAYARSKLAAENALTVRAHFEKFSLASARVFGLLAPQQSSHYVLQGLLRRRQKRDVENVPGLNYVRDYLDARDVCRVLVRLAELHFRDPEVFNVCSGRPTTVRQLLQLLFWPEIVHPSAAPGRPDDVEYIVGNPKKLMNATGLVPWTIALTKTVRDAREAAQWH